MGFFRSPMLALLAVVLTQASLAQRERAPHGTYANQHVAKQGIITTTLARGDSVLVARTVDLNEEVRIIVQFSDPPLGTMYSPHGRRSALGGALGALQSRIEDDHTRFRSDLMQLEGAPRQGLAKGSLLKVAGSRITQEYREAFNGFAISSRRWLVDRLRSLPYVKAIFPDRALHIQDSVSNHQIGADEVWAQYGATGDSIRIGVLDTGIDYLHPDLGGGFGAGYKVAGGWDFVNKDADPRDDNGHGTHVAGIIAANGANLKGVAPQATLYAYKVFDSQGNGTSSDFIAALELAVNPDGNPSTDDHLDIVNCSGGSTGGDPSDPMSQAVDNASAAGVLCVVSAGNGGPQSQSIASPGCAASALTVGACDAQDALTFFSSQGPTNTLFTIKPDLLAPGVRITSTFLDGGYQSMSGTSMAAPHAAGGAALLKQLHRDWTPAMLKGALMAAAKDLGQNVWQQGSGRLDVWKAAQSRVVAYPQTLSFGLDLLGQKIWTVHDTVTIVNLTDTAKNFTVGGTTGLPAGFSLNTDAPNFTLSAHESRLLVITLDVDNTTIQIPNSDLQDIKGILSLASAQDSLKFPWAVVMGSYLDITLQTTYPTTPDWGQLARYSDGKLYSVFDDPLFAYPTGTVVRKLLPVGTYEAVLTLDTYDTTARPWKLGLAWVVRDSVNVIPTAAFSVSEGDACYRVGAIAKDEQGLLIDSTQPLSWAVGLTSKRTGTRLGYEFLPLDQRLYQVLNKISPFSSNFVFEYYYATPPDRPKVYTYAGQVSPLMTDHVLDVQPSDFARRDIRYILHGTDQILEVSPTLEMTNRFYSISYGWDSTSPGLSAPFQQTWYALGQPVTNFPFGGVLINHQLWYAGPGKPPFDGGSAPLRLVTPNQTPGIDGVLRSSLLLTTTPVQQSRGKKVAYGLGPHHFFGSMANSPTSLLLRTNSVAGMFLFPSYASAMYVPLFLNQAMDFQPDWHFLYLRDSSGTLIQQGTSQDLSHLDISGTLPDVTLNMALPTPGRYTLQVWDPASYVLSLKGTATASLTFDTRLADRNPPTMTSFNILGADSEYTDMLIPGQAGRVEFRASDVESGLRSVNLYFHTDSNRTWQNLPLTVQGDLYRAQLPPFTLQDALISFQVIATDLVGNSLDYLAEPALHIGSNYTYANRAPLAPRLLKPTPGGMLQLYEFGHPTTFSWNPSLDYDGWDTLSYTFHLRGSGLGTSYDKWLRDSSCAFFLMSSLVPDESYKWWVESTDGHVVVHSDTATFQTSSTILAAPGDKSDVPREFMLSQNYPNPFNPSTTIQYDLPTDIHVALRVYDVLGQEVMRLVDANQRAGRYSVVVDGRNLASGFYIYRLEAVPSRGAAGTDKHFTAVKKFLIIR